MRLTSSIVSAWTHVRTKVTETTKHNKEPPYYSSNINKHKKESESTNHKFKLRPTSSTVPAQIMFKAKPGKPQNETKKHCSRVQRSVSISEILKIQKTKMKLDFHMQLLPQRHICAPCWFPNI